MRKKAGEFATKRLSSLDLEITCKHHKIAYFPLIETFCSGCDRIQPWSHVLCFTYLRLANPAGKSWPRVHCFTYLCLANLWVFLRIRPTASHTSAWPTLQVCVTSRPLLHLPLTRQPFRYVVTSGPLLHIPLAGQPSRYVVTSGSLLHHHLCVCVLLYVYLCVCVIGILYDISFLSGATPARIGWHLAKDGRPLRLYPAHVLPLPVHVFLAQHHWAPGKKDSRIDRSNSKQLCFALEMDWRKYIGRSSTSISFNFEPLRIFLFLFKYWALKL